jgi:hypothetical protein
VPGIEVPDDVLVTGPYDKERLGDLLQDLGVTIGLIPSVCQETYNYVTQESMNLGLPLVCFDLVAPAERIRAWEYGMVAGEISAQGALDALEMLDMRRISRIERHDEAVLDKPLRAHPQIRAISE